ncbi:hypothetical protein BUALT_Bualt17G0033200 [Buddleja alternifolia]|uniref:RING-type domain-containing protein n=1 Tax=Buddleja alternifolia TaxID=168488 RepID=A0AAV6WGF4_9LAMI|nr:hypothetical protein BUALT_Bualt17G0033200 [Buddleja alternifolia]
MGLSNFHGPAEGVLPLLVMNTVMSVALVKNKLRSVLQVVGAGGGAADQEFDDEFFGDGSDDESSRERRVSITRYGSLCRNRCRFEADEEVSELSCKHFFHKGCLEKWFGNQHVSCPLCRSTL